MLRNQIYYGLKPYIPYGLRLALRRHFAARLRETTREVWPVLPGSEQPPEGWEGWPGGKKFALVLTHDVEGPDGLAKCRELMELERGLGFRSSFNFIPEGSYRVSSQLREDLVRYGFEVGIHDFRHDGFLFQSSRRFSQSAPKINRYIKDWGACGFRSGFMLTDLDWLHQLDIRYDASTFDTDPFEPSPVGHKSIFPFWVERPEHPSLKSRPPGYVELPYTLAQDSTLFLILREETADVWNHKLDWIAEHGGMALLNTHPDYMGVGGAIRVDREYPIDRYADFLRRVKEKYEGSYWHANPAEVAEWFRKAHVPAVASGGDRVVNSRPFVGKRAAVVLFSYYPADPRPRREAEALVESGMEVDLICLQNLGEAPHEVINGVNVRRVPMRRKREGKLTYFLQYSQFIIWTGLALLSRTFSRSKYDLVHVHNMPDVLAFSALGPKLRGAKVILDLHDPMPELMTAIFGLAADHYLVRFLQLLEKFSIGFVDRVVTVNSHCKQIFSRRSCQPGKVQVIMNTPDERIFGLHEVSVATDRDPARRYVLMFHGSLVERHGVDLAVQAVRQVRRTIPNVELRIYGHTTPFLESVLESCRKEQAEGVVRYFGAKSLDEIVTAIGECDAGLVPNRRSVFTEINTPTRIFEYLACGKPVIAPRAPGITDYFGPQDLLFFELGDADDLARAIQEAFLDPQAVREVVARGIAVYRGHTWSREKIEFLKMVGVLLNADMPHVPRQDFPLAASIGG